MERTVPSQFGDSFATSTLRSGSITGIAITKAGFPVIESS